MNELSMRFTWTSHVDRKRDDRIRHLKLKHHYTHEKWDLCWELLATVLKLLGFLKSTPWRYSLLCHSDSFLKSGFSPLACSKYMSAKSVYSKQFWECQYHRSSSRATVLKMLPSTYVPLWETLLGCLSMATCSPLHPAQLSTIDLTACLPSSCPGCRCESGVRSGLRCQYWKSQ